MKKVLATGATGFIGRHSLPRLLESGYEVHAVGGQRPPEVPSRDIVWHRANLLEPGEIASLVGRVQPTHLLHFAWYAVPGKYWTAPENLAWVRATINLMQVFSDHGGRRAGVAGGCAEKDWEIALRSEGFS